VWQVAKEAHLQLSLHLGTGKGVGDKVKPANSNKRPPFMTRNYVNAIQEVQRSFTDIILRVCELLPICVDQGEYRLAAPSAA